MKCWFYLHFVRTVTSAERGAYSSARNKNLSIAVPNYFWQNNKHAVFTVLCQCDAAEWKIRARFCLGACGLKAMNVVFLFKRLSAVWFVVKNVFVLCQARVLSFAPGLRVTTACRTTIDTYTVCDTTTKQIATKPCVLRVTRNSALRRQRIQA